MVTSTAWGRIAEDGTVYVRTSDEGERVVGSWQAGTPEEGLAHFVRRYDDLATEVDLLETRLASGAASASSTVVAATKLRASLPTANAVGDLTTLDTRLCALLATAEAKRAEERAAKAAAATQAVDAKKALAEEAEKLAQSTQWKPSGDRLRAIVEEWKEIKGVDRKIDAELWKRVSAARAEFGRRRGAHFATLDEQRKEAVAYKEKLVTEAESIAGIDRVDADGEPLQVAHVAMESGRKGVERRRRGAVAALPHSPGHLLHSANSRSRGTRSRVPHEPASQRGVARRGRSDRSVRRSACCASKTA